MTHNQVAYWDSIYRNRNAERANEISSYEAETSRFNAYRNEYWTHKNYNWNESMFGYQLFKDLSSNLITMALFG